MFVIVTFASRAAAQVESVTRPEIEPRNSWLAAGGTLRRSPKAITVRWKEDIGAGKFIARLSDRRPRRNGRAQSTRAEQDEELTRRLHWPIVTISLLNRCIGRDIRSGDGVSQSGNSKAVV